MKIDAFAHILTPNYYQKMLDIDPDIPDKYPFLKINLVYVYDFMLSLPSDTPEEGIRSHYRWL